MVYCQKHQCNHRVFPKYASCIESKTIIENISTLRKDNHTIGCDLEAYGQTLRYRGYVKEADMLDYIASIIK
jgi:hypothetical protein